MTVFDAKRKTKADAMFDHHPLGFRARFFLACSATPDCVAVLGTTQARLGHQELEQGISRVVKLLACETKTHKQKLIQQHKVLKQVQTMQKISKVIPPYLPATCTMHVSSHASPTSHANTERDMNSRAHMHTDDTYACKKFMSRSLSRTMKTRTALSKLKRRSWLERRWASMSHTFANPTYVKEKNMFYCQCVKKKASSRKNDLNMDLHVQMHVCADECLIMRVVM